MRLLTNATLIAMCGWVPICAQSTELEAKERSGASIGIYGGKSFFGAEACALSAHGGGLLFAIQKFDQASSPDYQLGVGVGDYEHQVHFGLLLIGVEGNYTGTGIGLHLRGGYTYDWLTVGVSGQTVYGSKRSHSEIMASVGYRF
jgi:hypothetical protein